MSLGPKGFANAYDCLSGGGGTFGVVMESTTLASLVTKIQSMSFSIQNANQTEVEDIFNIFVDNVAGWAKNGWGGGLQGLTLIYVNPVLDNASARETMAPMFEYAAKVEGASAVLTEYPTWGAYFEAHSIAFPTVSRNLSVLALPDFLPECRLKPCNGLSFSPQDKFCH